MSTTERPGLPFRGLLTVSSASIAPDALFLSWLHYAPKIGLAGDQIAQLLEIGREYDEQLYDLRADMVTLAESVRVESGRLDDEALDVRMAALARRASRFAEEETLYLDYLAKGHAVLTDEQVTKANQIETRVRDADLRELHHAVDSTLGAGVRLAAT